MDQPPHFPEIDEDEEVRAAHVYQLQVEWLLTHIHHRRLQMQQQETKS